MNKEMNEKKLYLFLIVVAIQSLAANFAHPITPTLLKNLQLPDYMFGVAFAAMSFTNFLFSPFWAKMVTRISSRKTLLICCAGYAAGQFMFMISTTIATIVIGRLISGFFVGGIMVSYLMYIINKTTPESRGKHLALNATVTTVFGAFGYLIGGLLGVYSIGITFLCQVITLFVSGILFYVILDDDASKIREKINLIQEANPFRAFIDSKKFMTKILAILFFVVFITSLASTTYDQSFNYFIKDAFNFNSSYNGFLRAIVGFVSLIANTTICLWILRNTDVKKSLVYVFLGASICLFLMFVFDSIIPFIMINVIFFAFNAIYIPLVQDLCANKQGSEGTEIMGFYNAMKSLGMIFGGLYAGFVYSVGAKLSFLSAGLFFLIAVVMMLLYQRQEHN